MSKKYGLILPNSKAGSSKSAPKADFSKPSIFGSDSDSDDPGPKKISAIGPGTTEKRQARRIQEKALKEDPTVFQYDELYDDIETKRDEEKKSKSSEVQKPKYIGRLLEYAERRKIENERRLERVVQKEREEEGEQFADKESFVTSSYRKKLEELKEAEEREKREDYLEAIGDVTKQQDLGGFYRHIYEQKLKTKDDKEPEAKAKSKSREPERESSPSEGQAKSSSKPRVYRKRKASDDENNSTPERKEGAGRKAHLQSNLDADSDFSIDDSSSSSSSSSSEDDAGDATPKKKKASHDTKRKSKKNSIEAVVKQEPTEEKPRQASAIDDTDESKEKEIMPEIKMDAAVKQEKVEDENDSAKQKAEVKKEKKVKKDIWKKRTVGEVFDAALKRFYERKALRNG